jgi:hypothetical protein
LIGFREPKMVWEVGVAEGVGVTVAVAVDVGVKVAVAVGVSVGKGIEVAVNVAEGMAATVKLTVGWAVKIGDGARDTEVVALPKGNVGNGVLVSEIPPLTQ